MSIDIWWSGNKNEKKKTTLEMSFRRTERAGVRLEFPAAVSHVEDYLIASLLPPYGQQQGTKHKQRAGKLKKKNRGRHSPANETNIHTSSWWPLDRDEHFFGIKGNSIRPGCCCCCCSDARVEQVVCFQKFLICIQRASTARTKKAPEKVSFIQCTLWLVRGAFPFVR